MTSETMLPIAAICAPFVAVTIGLIFNGRQLDSLRKELTPQFEAITFRLGLLEKDITIIVADLRQFYRDTGELKGRLDTLEKRVH